MRITVLHNPKAGDDDHAGELIVETLERAGHTVRYHSTRKSKLRKALERDSDLILIAGGDGTVKKVATRLDAGAPPIAILPVGTANNVAKALGAWSGLRELAEGLESAERRRLDVGIAGSQHSEHRFIEAMGGGACARLVRSGDRTDDAAPLLPGNSIDRALHLLASDLRQAEPRHWGVWIDGRDASGEYLVVEVMNMRMLGPNVPLACDADPGDGLLNVVTVTPEQRHDLLAYLSQRIAGEQAALTLPSTTARTVELEVFGEFMHVDDEPWPPDSEDEDDDDGDAEGGKARVERRGRRSPDTLTGRISAKLDPAGVDVLVVPASAPSADLAKSGRRASGA